MKWLLLLMLVANIALFAWHYPESTRDPEPRPAKPGPGTLTLLSEMDARGGAPEPEHNSRLADRGCFASQALDSRDEATDLQQAVADGRALVAPLEELRQLGHWVYLPPMDSGAAAEARLSELRELGITDVSLVRQEEQRHAISLGVFSSEERARERQEQLLREGVEAETGERLRRTERYRVVVTDITADALPADFAWSSIDCQATRD
ncbi:MAG: SPOR domain-containing protein [Ectothiorhodospiraceae bacterium]|nr:SPOR domain-containing protein [Ectothiorhodospiraceae bacterium]